jgi:antibiotic biosynthesis monooxygenase (ABM) superfamily enzyme
VIERHVTFRLVPGKAETFETFFGSAYAPAMAAQPGFCGAELLGPLEPDGSLVMVLRFSDTKTAQSWRESPAHRELSPVLKSLYQTSDVRVYNVLAARPGE